MSAKEKGTKPQSTGSLSSVVLLQSGLAKKIQNSLSMLIQNKSAVIPKGKLLLRSPVPSNHRALKKGTDVVKTAKQTQMSTKYSLFP